MQEKKAAMLADEEEQRRLDMEMEVERIKALEAYHVSKRAFRMFGILHFSLVDLFSSSQCDA